jgi:hypothetical protein
MARKYLGRGNANYCPLEAGSCKLDFDYFSGVYVRRCPIV